MKHIIIFSLLIIPFLSSASNIFLSNKNQSNTNDQEIQYYYGGGIPRSPTVVITPPYGYGGGNYGGGTYGGGNYGGGSNNNNPGNNSNSGSNNGGANSINLEQFYAVQATVNNLSKQVEDINNRLDNLSAKLDAIDLGVLNARADDIELAVIELQDAIFGTGQEFVEETTE